MKKIIAIALVCLLAVSVLTACGNTEKKDAHITTVLTSEPSTLDMARFLGINDRTVLFSVTEPLTRIQNGVVTKAGAEKYEVSDDGLTYTFTIRENYWSDGQRVTANDYLVGLQREADPKNAFSFATDFFSIENFEKAFNGEAKTTEIGVTAPDDNTLVIKLASANPALLSSVDIFPVRSDMVEKYGDKYGSEAESILSCGPFTLDSWTHESSMEFTKNEKYWDKDNVKLNGFTYSIITDVGAQMSSLENGSVDYATVDTQEYADKFAQNSDMQEITVATGRTAMVAFNCEDSVFKNQKIRTAFAISLDRDKLVEVITGGIGSAAYALVPEDGVVGDMNFRKTVNNLPSKNLEEKYKDAKALLAEGMKEAGLGEDTSALTVKLAYGGADAASRTYAELYQQMWQTALGVKVEIDFNETATHLANVKDGKYQIATVSWGSTPEPSFQLSRFATPTGGQPRWINEEYVGLVNDGMAEPDDSKRLEDYKKAEELLISEAAIAPAYYTANRTFAYNYVGGIPTGAFDTTGVKTLYIK